MDDRPDWLPEDVDYGRYPFVRPCFYCDDRATQGGDSLERGMSWFWCDSPECEQAAREAITGGEE